MTPAPPEVDGPSQRPSLVDVARGSHRIVLCADDYGMTEGISRAMLELVRAQKLSALSAMTTTPAWPASAPNLAAARASVAVGLHLDLTTGMPRTRDAPRRPDGRFEPLKVVMRRAFLRRSSARALRDEIDAQLDAFEAATGHPPDHVDGHQHVHVLPGIREALFDSLVARYAGRLPLVRDPTPSLPALIDAPVAAKSWLIGALASGFARAARARGCPVNDTFAGFSAFSERREFAAELARGFEQGHGLQIVMCHPGHPGADVLAWDAVNERRGTEFEVLLAAPADPRLFRPLRPPANGALAWHHSPAASP